jgi:hypothetical protein
MEQLLTPRKIARRTLLVATLAALALPAMARPLVLEEFRIIRKRIEK